MTGSKCWPQSWHSVNGTFGDYYDHEQDVNLRKNTVFQMLFFMASLAVFCLSRSSSRFFQSLFNCTISTVSDTEVSLPRDRIN